MDELATRAVDAASLAGNAAAHDMSMLGLFMQADIVVKIVMMILIFSSIWCWAVIFEKRATLNSLKHHR